MKAQVWKKWIACFLSVVLLTCSIPESPVYATADGEDASDTSGLVEDVSSMDGNDMLYQYVEFSDMGKEVEIVVPDVMGVSVVETDDAEKMYCIERTWIEELVFFARVPMGNRLEIPQELENIVVERVGRYLEQNTWQYEYYVNLRECTATEKEPVNIRLNVVSEGIAVKINGNAIVEGVDENGYAQAGEQVSIEVTDPGFNLAKRTKDENGNDVYTAMELDYDNRYVFTVEEGVEFFVVNPEQVDYHILNSNSNKAKINGVDGLELLKLESSAQGFDEIVLNFTAIKNGTDGTETEKVYYEVKVNAVEIPGETLPEGSSVTPVYYYIPKVEDTNVQSKSIKVNRGNLSAPTAATYEFSVKMVMIDKNAAVPEENVAMNAPLTVKLSNNTLTKQFATKNPYIEDKLGFKKKNTTIYTGQHDLLVGSVKYSDNASYLHDLTAVAYDSEGAICDSIFCEFKNDNDELYVSTYRMMAPGKYTIVIYASIGEEGLKGPQEGTMYQATTSFVLTVKPGIFNIDTTGIIKKIAVNNKNVSFSAVPVGGGWGKVKQKFSYEIKSVKFAEDGSYVYIDPTDKVKNNISVNSKGKVTINKAFYVDENEEKNYFAIAIKAEDYEGNDTRAYAVVQIVATTSVPTTIYLTNSSGYRFGTTINAFNADSARVIVLDQNGNCINDQVKITPTNNTKRTTPIYVSQSPYDGSAYLMIRKCTTVTIKATMKDGSKRSKSLKVKITKPKVTGACFSLTSITYKGVEIDDYDTSTGLIRYNAPKGAEIKFRQGAKHNGNGYYNTNWFNWKYKITGGKLKVDGNYWVVTPNKRTAVLTVWDKANPKQTWNLEFVNTSWNTSYEVAPKLKLTEGKLYNKKYSNSSNLVYDPDWEAYDVTEQEVTYQYDFGSYDEAKITRMSNGAPYLYIKEFNPKSRTIKFAAYAYVLPAGSYKYTVTFYRNGELACMPTTITVKFHKANKLKVTSSYTLDTAYGNGVKIKCSVKDFYPDFAPNVLNANVGGKANEFNKYFEVVYKMDEATGINTPMIQFKSSVTAAEKEKLKGTTQTGYVRYSYYYGYSEMSNQTAKVSIKIK